jgi:hypothetical protein
MNSTNLILPKVGLAPMTQTPDPNRTPVERLPLNERIANILLKAIMTGGVGLGGIGAFWSLFLKEESDIPRAVASVLIGLGISYAAKMLQPIHRGNLQRLEQLGIALNKGIERILNQVAGIAFNDQYLECQALACQAVRSDGIAQHEGIFTPLLKEVFVPLELHISATAPGFKQLTPKLLANQELDIWQLLAKTTQEPTFRQIAILAWGGYGKTTLLKHIAYLYGKKQQPRSVPKLIPMLLVLRKYRDLLMQDQLPNLPCLITTHHIPGLPGATDLWVPPNWAKERLEQGEAVILLDGFDEVPKAQRPVLARWINQQMQQYSKSVFILTSRPKAYRDQEIGDRLELSTPLWVKDFNANQRQDFVQRWYCCQERYANGGRDTPDVQQMAAHSAQDLLAQIKARQELKDLAKNPLLLNMIVTFHRRYPGVELPKRRVELYREICLLQLRDRPAARKLETLLTQCEAQTILQMLALSMMKSRQERIGQTALLRGLTQCLKQQEETVEATEFLQQIVQISELLVEQEDEYEFAHLSFQEYLAATQIAQQKQASLLYEYFNDDWWKQTILLYAAQVNPTHLIREAMERGAANLVYLCCQDTTKQLSPALRAEIKALKQTVQTSRYQTLASYLKDRQWQEADKETYRLMIATLGKEEGQWFEREDLLNFPCEELREIDRLWVKYSDGKFGFGVQKQTYVECGAALDGQYPGDKIWERFCDRVGWRELNTYIPYSQATFDISAPNGHLPWFWGFGVVVWGGLFSRIEACKL